MARSGFIWGGLLQGLGSGLSMQAAQMREDALENLRNQRAIESEDRREARDIRAEDRATTVKVGLLDLAQKYKREEWETEQQYQERLLQMKGEIEAGHIAQRGEEDRATAQEKGAIDRSLEAFKFGNEKEIEAIRAANRGDEVHSTDVAADGSLVVMFKNGKKVRLKEKMDTGDSGGLGIGDALDRRGSSNESSSSRRTPSSTPSKSSPPTDQAEALEQALNEGVKNGSVPKGTYEGEVLQHPNGGEARWTNGKWVLFKVPKAARDRGF